MSDDLFAGGFAGGDAIWPDAGDTAPAGGSPAHGDHGDWPPAHHDLPLDPSGLAAGVPHAADAGDAGPFPIDFPIDFPMDSSGLTGDHLTVDHGSAVSKVPVGAAAPDELDGESKSPAGHGFADLKVPAGALDDIVSPGWGAGPKLHVVDPGEGNRGPGADIDIIDAGDTSDSDASDGAKKGDGHSHPFTVREDDSRKDDRSVQKVPASPPVLQDRRGLDSPQHPEVTRQPWDLHIVNDPLFDRLPRADTVVLSEEVGPYWRVEVTRYGQLYLEETTIDGDRTGRFVHLSAKDWGQWGVGFDQDEQDIDSVTIEFGQTIGGSYERSYHRTFKSDPSANLEP